VADLREEEDASGEDGAEFVVGQIVQERGLAHAWRSVKFDRRGAFEDRSSRGDLFLAIQEPGKRTW